MFSYPSSGIWSVKRDRETERDNHIILSLCSTLNLYETKSTVTDIFISKAKPCHNLCQVLTLFAVAKVAKINSCLCAWQKRILITFDRSDPEDRAVTQLRPCISLLPSAVFLQLLHAPCQVKGSSPSPSIHLLQSLRSGTISITMLNERSHFILTTWPSRSSHSSFSRLLQYLSAYKGVPALCCGASSIPP